MLISSRNCGFRRKLREQSFISSYISPVKTNPPILYIMALICRHMDPSRIHVSKSVILSFLFSFFKPLTSPRDFAAVAADERIIILSPSSLFRPLSFFFFSFLYFIATPVISASDPWSNWRPFCRQIYAQGCVVTIRSGTWLTRVAPDSSQSAKAKRSVGNCLEKIIIR